MEQCGIVRVGSRASPRTAAWCGRCWSSVTLLLAEQNASIALRYASYGYIPKNGRVVPDNDASASRDNEYVKEFYLGLSAAGRRSFRDIKSYKRRRRWL